MLSRDFADDLEPDLTELLGTEIGYLARGPPGGPVDEYVDVSIRGDIESGIIDKVTFGRYCRDCQGSLLSVHNHPPGHAVPSQADIEKLQWSNEIAGRPMAELIYGKTGMFRSALYRILRLAYGKPISRRTYYSGIHNVLDYLKRYATIRKTNIVEPFLDLPKSYSACFTQVTDGLVDIYSRHKHLSLAYSIDDARPQGWRPCGLFFCDTPAYSH